MHSYLKGIPKISIVTPSFNQGQFLEETIQSVLNQDYPKLEYIIIDGGSTDNSVDIIKKYEDRLAYWVSEPDKGQSHAINKGVSRATGEIINWINSDDLLCDDALLKVGGFFCSHPDIDVCYGDNIPIDINGRVITFGRCLSFSMKMLLSGIILPQQSTFFRRSLVDKYGGIDEGLTLCMDYELQLKYAFNNCTFHHINTPIGKFRYYAETKSNVGKSSNIHIEEKRAIQIKYLKKYYGDANISSLRKWFIWFTFCRWIKNIDNIIIHWKFYLRRLIKFEIGKTFKGY